MRQIRVIDSHTGGEPTRLVIQGGPDLGRGTPAELRDNFRKYHDRFRSAIVNEPRGSNVLVGAIMCGPTEQSSVGGVIFFNNVGYLGMCGHGTIGLVTTLNYLGRIDAGELHLETPVGKVSTVLHADGSVSVRNVESFRQARDVPITVPEIGTVTGDVAYGGNWFFLVREHGLDIDPANVEALTDLCWKTRLAVNAQGFPEVDHVELFGPPRSPKHNSQNFVLCPGKAYDRSPCGTGTSAKLACLAADSKLAEHENWIQESILGSTFTGSFQWIDRDRGLISPMITGQAHITADITLLLDEDDPFCWGIGKYVVDDSPATLIDEP